jgi:hypothetical protein
MRSLSIEQYRGNRVASAKLGDVVETGMRLGQYEFKTSVHFVANGNSPMYFELTVRSPNDLENALNVINGLLPRSPSSIETFVEGVEAAAKAEGITLNVGMLRGHTSKLDRSKGSNGRASL